MKVCGLTFSSARIAQLKRTIATQPGLSRQKLARQVCEWLNWRSPNGTLKAMNCRKALLQLQRQGLIELPEARHHPNLRKSSSSVAIEAFPARSPLECLLAELGPIAVVRIKRGDRAQSRQWNAMMNRYHYLGAGPLCGAQIRYFIHSEHSGILGGLAFSAAAWRVSARDRWIGWNDSTRQQRLNLVVNNSRFLILPQVKVKNLASYVLTVAAKQLAIDWPDQYAIEPVLLETFVEKERFPGTCYRAANWIHVGQTKGRGRQDSNNSYSIPIKDVYVYPLYEKVPVMLNGGSNQGHAVAPRVAVDWAEEEFGTSQLGDQRRDNRLLTIARDFYARPQASVPSR
ncbi:MAG TPA: Druantia anti-phage system protein DruA [bacterium]